jgi:hypothetical protein
MCRPRPWRRNPLACAIDGNRAPSPGDGSMLLVRKHATREFAKTRNVTNARESLAVGQLQYSFATRLRPAKDMRVPRARCVTTRPALSRHAPLPIERSHRRLSPNRFSPVAHPAERRTPAIRQHCVGIRRSSLLADDFRTPPRSGSSALSRPHDRVRCDPSSALAQCQPTVAGSPTGNAPVPQGSREPRLMASRVLTAMRLSELPVASGD